MQTVQSELVFDAIVGVQDCNFLGQGRFLGGTSAAPSVNQVGAPGRNSQEQMRCTLGIDILQTEAFPIIRLSGGFATASTMGTTRFHTWSQLGHVRINFKLGCC